MYFSTGCVFWKTQIYTEKDLFCTTRPAQLFRSSTEHALVFLGCCWALFNLEKCPSATFFEMGGTSGSFNGLIFSLPFSASLWVWHLELWAFLFSNILLFLQEQLVFADSLHFGMTTQLWNQKSNRDKTPISGSSQQVWFMLRQLQLMYVNFCCTFHSLGETLCCSLQLSAFCLDLV